MERPHHNRRSAQRPPPPLRHTHPLRRAALLPSAEARGMGQPCPSGGPNDELVALYHNVELQPLRQVAIEFLLARFAWSVFARCTFILPGPVARTLLVVKAQTLNAVVCEMSGDEYMAEFGRRSTSGPPSRSKSPRKSAWEGDVPEEGEGGEGDETDEEDELWGRPRKRWCEEERLNGVYALPSPAE